VQRLCGPLDLVPALGTVVGPLGPVVGPLGPVCPVVGPVSTILHLCASKMRMEPLLFAGENAPEWAFISGAKKRKGVKKWIKTIIYVRFVFCFAFLIHLSTIAMKGG
jgi:hypothetical protein